MEREPRFYRLRAVLEDGSGRGYGLRRRRGHAHNHGRTRASVLTMDAEGVRGLQLIDFYFLYFVVLGVL